MINRKVYLVWLWGCLDSIHLTEKAANERRKYIAKSEWSDDGDWTLKDHTENCSEVVEYEMGSEYEY